MGILGIISLLTSVEPLAVNVIKDLQALFAKHPTIDPNAIAAAVVLMAQQTQGVDLDTLNIIKQDQASSPTAKANGTT